MGTMTELANSVSNVTSLASFATSLAASHVSKIECLTLLTLQDVSANKDSLTSTFSAHLAATNAPPVKPALPFASRVEETEYPTEKTAVPVLQGNTMTRFLNFVRIAHSNVYLALSSTHLFRLSAPNVMFSL